MQHGQSLPANELMAIRANLENMVISLDAGEYASVDEPERHIVVVGESQNGEKGRPKVLIDEDILREGIRHLSWAELGRRLGCHPRTVRRRALELGLVEGGGLVRQTVEDEGGQTSEVITTYGPAMANLSDEELDSQLREMYETFPSFGREMIQAYFRLYGYRVSRSRIRLAQQRVIGALPLFGRRRIERRVYRVAGPNALWHNDGWHGEVSSH